VLAALLSIADGNRKARRYVLSLVRNGPRPVAGRCVVLR